MHFNDYYISFFDIIILIPFGWGIYKGFINGFIVEAISLSVLLLGMYAYIRIIEMPNRLVSKEVAQTLEYLPLILFTITFSVIVFLSNVTERFIVRVTAGVALPGWNRFLGILISGIKYVIIISGFLIFFDKLDEKYTMLSPEDTDGSLFYSKFIRVAPTIFPYLSFDNIKNRRYIKAVKEASIRTNEGRIPIGPSMKSLAGYAGIVNWTSYQSPSYKDNHDLIIVEATVENQDGKFLQTAVFEFLYNKRKGAVELFSFKVNGKRQEKSFGYNVMKEGNL